MSPSRRVWLIVTIVVLLPGATLVLWGASVPGGGLMLALVGLWLLALVGLFWVIEVVRFAAARRRGGSGTPAWILVAVPVVAGGVLALSVSGLPARARFTASRRCLDRYVAQRTTRELGPSQVRQWSVRPTICGYRVSDAHRQGDAVLLTLPAAGFVDPAGLAHLPSGPFPELANGDLEPPEFRSLGHGWYTWTGSF